MNIGYRLREIRKAKGLNQEELANLSYVSPSSIKNYETGRQSPTVETFVNILNALGVDHFDVMADPETVIEEKGKEYDRVLMVVGSVYEKVKNCLSFEEGLEFVQGTNGFLEKVRNGIIGNNDGEHICIANMDDRELSLKILEAAATEWDPCLTAKIKQEVVS